MLAITSLVRFAGVATGEDGRPLYREEYTVEKQDDRIVSIKTSFYSPEGDYLGRLVSNFDGEDLPNIRFDKTETSYSVQKAESLVTLVSGSKEKTLSRKKNMTCGHGLYFFILSHLDTLLSGDKEQLNFIMPQKLTSYDFLVTARTNKESPDIAEIEMVIKNPILRAFTPKISMSINHKSGALLSYKGVDGFLGRASSKMPVSITYSDPAPIFLLDQDLPDDQSLSSQIVSREPESQSHPPSS